MAESAGGDLVTAGEAGVDIHPVRVHSQYDTLGTEGPGAGSNNIGIDDRQRVDRDLFGTGQQYAGHILKAGDPAAYGERDADGSGDLTHHVDIDRTPFGRSRDVVEYKLIAAVVIVLLGHGHGIAQVDVVLESDALGYPAIVDVQARDDTLSQHA